MPSTIQTKATDPSPLSLVDSVKEEIDDAGRLDNIPGEEIATDKV